ncbi:MAG: aminopeptidase P N-terminal domain-containing protein [Candidatus Babeliaceae bacterium]|nr:aminopeptidase P N-terminal domain-containing protein [Candidatus Babeliaceae bacterium]
MVHNGAVFSQRRAALAKRVGSPVFLIGGFEVVSGPFVQESSFFYFTGISEPGLTCLIDADGRSTLFVPKYPAYRTQWTESLCVADTATAQKYGFDSVEFLGAETPNLNISFFSPQDCWHRLIEVLLHVAEKHGKVGTVLNNEFLCRLFLLFPELRNVSVDVMREIAVLRRKKDAGEVGLLRDAARMTATAQLEIAGVLREEDCTEGILQKSFEVYFLGLGAQTAFTPIVAAGANSTVVHHQSADKIISNDETVVFDAGARLNGYCADITRTYPVSGTFSKRQREIYEIVLETQERVIEMARPGVYLSNKNEPEKSLYHEAKRSFAKYGLDEYFVHGIGHFIGLDVHDVGDPSEPLQPGDCFTIEPGLYLSNEGIGVRIEDMFTITDDGKLESISTDLLPRQVKDVEATMAALATMCACEECAVEDDECCCGCDD